MILNRQLPVRLVAAAVALACAALGPAWFWLGPAPPAGSTVRVALVQPGNIEDSAARQAAGEALTDDLRGRRVDLVVWGESSVGVDLAGDPDAVARLADLSRRVGADLLVNVDARDRTGEISKSSVLIGPGEFAARTRRCGSCRSANTFRCGRCSGGPLGIRRRRQKIESAAAESPCCTPKTSPSGR